MAWTMLTDDTAACMDTCEHEFQNVRRVMFWNQVTARVACIAMDLHNGYILTLIWHVGSLWSLDKKNQQKESPSLHATFSELQLNLCRQED